VYFTVPDVEDLTMVVEMLRGAGAEITDQRREFVVAGPLTAEQASAAWQLAEHTDNGRRLGVRVEPAGDLGAALDAMCTAEWDEDTFAWPEEDGDGCDRWWLGQQEIQSERRKQRRAQKTMTSAAAPPSVQVATPAAPVVDDGMCCGEGDIWASAGKPRVVGCKLCPNSPTYWRSQSGRQEMPV
jgi:hypothetical protein